MFAARLGEHFDRSTCGMMRKRTCSETHPCTHRAERAPPVTPRIRARASAVSNRHERARCRPDVLGESRCHKRARSGRHRLTPAPRRAEPHGCGAPSRTGESPWWPIDPTAMRTCRRPCPMASDRDARAEAHRIVIQAEEPRIRRAGGECPGMRTDTLGGRETNLTRSLREADERHGKCSPGVRRSTTLSSARRQLSRGSIP